ncbi:MAG: GAF domain-containing protein [Bacteroidota bacterium]
MAASATLPYFARPSVALDPEEKRNAYAQATSEIDAVLTGETDPMVKMVTINCLLKTHLPYYFWVGFYLVKDSRLVVGPYQGTLGCLTIDFGRGVCGKAARTGQTQIVEDVHQLQQGSEHIACDPNSRSEIVVPVFDAKGDLIAVFDVDSTLPGSFDEMDRVALEALLKSHFISSAV